ncbi:MAG: transporter, partial [bacterium]
EQLSGDSGDGAELGSFKAEAAGIGPVIMWIPSKYEGNVAFVAKWINEYHAENRLEGDHVFLSFMMSF